MAAITGSGQISFNDLFQNRSSGTPQDISLKTESETFASGSVVAGSPVQTTARFDLEDAPYALSEFYSADFPSSLITSVGFTTEGGGSDTNVVDNEDLDVTFNHDGTTGDYTVQILNSTGTQVFNTATSTVSSGTQKTHTFSNITNLSAGTFKTRVKFGGFNVRDSGNFTHFDLLTGGSTSISNGSQFVDAADESVSNVTLTPTVSTGVQTSTSIGTTVLTGGDGGNISVTNTSGTTYSVQNTPGVLRFDVTHIGNPSQARNNTTSTATLDVRYNSAIDGIAVDDTTVNSGQSFTISAVSEGVQSKTLRLGYGTSNSNTTYTANSDKSISDTRYVRSNQSQAFTVNLTSGTSLVQYFPKAHYTDDTGTLVAGTAFNVAPAFSYSATGNQTINIDQTADFGVSSIVGNGASIVVASSPNIGGATFTSNGTTTMNPDDNTGNGTYTISYTGTANFSQVNNATSATLTVRPKVSITSNNSAPKGLLGSYSSGLTPTGTSNESFTVTASTQGANLSYSWTLPSNFTDTAGGGSGDNSVTGFFSGGSEGIRQFALTVTGNSVASTQATEDVTYTGYTQQSISNVSPTSGNFRRGVTTLNVTFTSRNVAFAKILLIGVSTGTANKTFTASTDSLDSATADALESQSHSATITDVGQGDVGTYTVRVLDASDDSPSTDASGNITILDLEPTTPGAFNDSSSITAYHGSLTLDWSASSYRYQYQIFKSAGDSDASYSQLGSNQTGTSITISQTSHTQSNGPFYYKVRAINFAQGPLSTETSNFNSPVRIKVQPTLSANNNQPQPNLSTIFSTANNSSTTSTAVTLSNQSDNSNLAFSYALSSNSAGCSISNANTATPTVSAGSGVGSVVLTLTVTADPSQTQVQSGDTITVNYAPKIYEVTFTTGNLSNGDFIVNSSTISITSVKWQGSACSTFHLAVNSTSTPRNEPNGPNGTNNVVVLDGSTLTSAILNGNTGGAQIGDSFCQWTGNISLGTVDTEGTFNVVAEPVGESPTMSTGVASTQLTVLGWNTILITYPLGGITWSHPEQAFNQEGGSFSNFTKYYLGSFNVGTDLKNDQDANDNFNGGGNYYKISGYVIKVSSAGNVDEYILNANVPPKNPTGLTLGNVTTTSFTVDFTDNSTIEDGYRIYVHTSATGLVDSGNLEHTVTAGELPQTINSIDGSSLTAGTPYHVAVVGFNGTGTSDALTGSVTTLAATSWSSVFASFTDNGGSPSSTRTTTAKTLVLNNGSGNTTISRTTSDGITVAYSTNGSSYSSFSTSHTFSFTSGTLYVKFRKTFPKFGGSFTDTFRFTNNSVSVDRNVTMTAFDGGSP